MAGEKQLRYHTKEAGCCTELFRSLLLLVNVALALGSLALIGVGVWSEVISNQQLTKVCHACGSIIVGGIVLFCTLFIFSMVGFCALWKRNVSLLLLYGLYLVIFMLGALAITIVFVLIKEGNFDGTFNDIWTSSVSKGENVLCGFEQDFECSGWTTLCNQTAPYANSTLCPTCTAPQQVQIHNYTSTCYTVLTNDINKYFQPVVITGFALVGISLISIIVACKVRGDSDEEDEGSYQRV